MKQNSEGLNLHYITFIIFNVAIVGNLEATGYTQRTAARKRLSGRRRETARAAQLPLRPPEPCVTAEEGRQTDRSVCEGEEG